MFESTRGNRAMVSREIAAIRVLQGNGVSPARKAQLVQKVKILFQSRA